jgi:glycosyltransferase involved in cell wall biosynthesis
MKMKVYYISPSTIPSRSANSIHVANMCEGVSQLGHEVILFAHSNLCNSVSCQQQLKDSYGIDNSKIKLKIFHSKQNKGIEFFIALYALMNFILDLIKNRAPQYIISRNLYAAIFLGLLFRKNVIYETHSPEYSFRKKLQKWLLTSNKIKTVVISEALKKIIQDFHNISSESIYVFHDAARYGQLRLGFLQRKELSQQLLSNIFDLDDYQKVVGYFGHLYSGRGIEIIEELAKLNSSCAFVVYGGNETDIEEYKSRNTNKNLFFMGYIHPKKAYKAMAMMDVLLMPYQRFVSIGIKGVDTSKWMSPMKLFEYLSVGVPIISSNISVLKEVLVDGENCLLVEPDDVNAWSDALQRIILNEELEEKLGFNAYNLYKDKYTWKHRAKDMLTLI